MIPSSLISKKRDGNNLSKKEISWLINSFLEGKVSDAQMASFLMTIFYQGMNDDELFSLVETMVKSGSTLKFNNNGSYK